MTDLTTVDSITTQRLNTVVNVNILPFQSLTSAPRVVFASIDVSNVSAVSVYMHLGRTNNTAFTGSGINFRVEASHTTDESMWHTITTFTSALGSGIVSTTLNGATLAGATTFAVAAAGAIAAGNLIYIQDGTVTNSEFAIVTAVAGNNITVQNGLLNAHNTGLPVTNQAEAYYALIDTTTFNRLRITVDGSQQTSNVSFDTTADITTGA